MTELLIVVLIIGILSSLAVPSFRQMILSQRIKSMATDLNSSLTLARSEAIKRNKNVTLAPTSGGWNHWQDGWQIADPDNAGFFILDHARFEGLTALGPDNVVYRSSGRIQGATAPTFDISATGVAAHRWVCTDLSGRPFVKTTAC